MILGDGAARVGAGTALFGFYEETDDINGIVFVKVILSEDNGGNGVETSGTLEDCLGSCLCFFRLVLSVYQRGKLICQD